jgi:hypothetical protein
MAEDTLDETPAAQAADHTPPDQRAGAERVEIHHKPKSWHGPREFLKEYAIIVLGVLTALAAEQTVEALHHRAQAREMTEKLRAESEENRHVIAYDLESLTQGLASTDAVLAALTKGERPPPPLGRPDLFLPADAAWTAIRDSALLPIMPKLLIDNGWKVDATQGYLDSRMSAITQSSDQAEAALAARQATPGDADLGRTARLRLAELRVQEVRLIGGMAEFQRIDEQMVRGERIDTPGASQPAPARK